MSTTRSSDSASRATSFRPWSPHDVHATTAGGLHMLDRFEQDWIDPEQLAGGAFGRSSGQLRVLIAEGSRLAAEALMFTLDSDPCLEAIGYGLDGWEALELVASLEPDAVLVGPDLERLDQLEFTAWLHEFFPDVLPILIRRTLVPQEVENAYATGAADCLPESCSADELLHAVSAARTRQLRFERGRRASALRLVKPEGVRE
jgi:CheY-like chemotaxis protein